MPRRIAKATVRFATFVATMTFRTPASPSTPSSRATSRSAGIAATAENTFELRTASAIGFRCAFSSARVTSVSSARRISSATANPRTNSTPIAIAFHAT